MRPRLDDSGQRRLEEMAGAAREIDLADPIIQSILLEAMAVEGRLPNSVHLGEINHTVRLKWFQRTLGERASRAEIDPIFALPIDLRPRLAELGLVGTAQQALRNIPEGREYRALCREEGVPPPPDWKAPSGMTRGDWRFEGDLQTNFLTLGDPTEVWSFTSDSPQGACIALPRFADEDWISANGIICLGTQTGRACFYDRAGLDPNQTYSIDEFQAGANLMGGGVCSDCHAGENPFVVHPDEPLNLGAAIRSPIWHVPLVKPSWPQNPGPSNILDMINLPSGQQECKSCHVAGFAGRFPDVNLLNLATPGLSGYCRFVVEGALNGISWIGVPQGPTMGMKTVMGGGEVSDPAFDVHRAAMLALCAQEVPPPEVVPVPEDDPEVVSPPLIGPLYACATAIEVRSTIHDAEVVLTINGTDLPPVIVDSSESIQFAVAALVEGDMVSARQTKDGETATSPVLTVISHLVDYPDGLPRPTIDPTLVHQCGQVIAVRHVEGATVVVTVNGGNERKATSGGDWTNIRPGKSPFDQGDQFIAQQFLCEDESDPSASVSAVAPPSPMPVPKLDPNPPLINQPYLRINSLAHGARTEVEEAGAGQVSSFSTAVDWNPEVNVENGLGRLIEAGDQFQIVSTLCEKVTFEPDPARPCESLPTPSIATPIVGNMSIHVTDYVPGARILVWDAGATKIGDSSGTEVGLTRTIVQGDILTVAQRLGRCISSEAYQVSAVCVTAECNLP